MTAVAALLAGTRLTAAEVQSIAPLAAYKGADQSLATNTTLQNDNALFISLLANATYMFACFLDYEGGTQGSADIKWQWTLPSGATMRYMATFTTTAGVAVTVSTYNNSAAVPAGSNGVANLRGVLMFGTVAMSTTPGTFQLQWAQNSSNATATIVHASSILAAWQIA